MLSYTFYLKFVTYNKSIMTFAPISFPMQSEPLPFASSASVIINDLAYKDSFNQFVIQCIAMERLSFSEIGWVVVVDLESKKCLQIHVYLFRVCFQLQPFQNRFARHKRALQDMLSDWGLFQSHLDNFFDQSIS